MSICMQKYVEYIHNIFNYIRIQSDNYNITIEESNDIFNFVNNIHTQSLYEQNTKIIDGVKFWTNIYVKIIQTSNINELSQTIRFFISSCEDSEHAQQNYNIVYFLMKICVNILWQLCYKLQFDFKDFRPKLTCNKHRFISWIVCDTIENCAILLCSGIVFCEI